MIYELKDEKHYEPDLKKEKNYKYFNLNNITGLLTLAKKLDREKHKIHEVSTNLVLCLNFGSSGIKGERSSEHL